MNHPDELISASLAGDLTDLEQAQLDQHMRECERCRATMTAFGDQRRLVGGLRHIAPPRDLGARVRTGIEAGTFAAMPWWRRPGSALLLGSGVVAVAAGAMLGFAVLSAAPSDSQVGGETGSPAPSVTVAVQPSPIAESPEPTATPPGPTEPSPIASPGELVPEPDVFLALTGPFDNLMPTLRDGRSGDTLLELPAVSGPPIAATLSPDGGWLAYITQVGQRGTNEVWAAPIAEALPPSDGGPPPSPIDSPIALGEAVPLGESLAGSPFLEHLAWSSDGQYLAYTLADPDGGGTEVWIFEPADPEPYPLTDAGSAYASSWVPGSAGTSLLWVSLAGNEPASFLLGLDDSAEPPEPVDPSQLTGGESVAMAVAEGVFQPLLNPQGSAAIFWRGFMAEAGGGTGDWIFVQGGAPYLAATLADGGEFGFEGDQPLFGDFVISRDAFTSAAIRWGPDGDAFAVWGAAWTGLPQTPDGSSYPDQARVYFGHMSEGQLLTRFHALDADDVPETGRVVNVAVSDTGDHLAITVGYPLGGVLEAPRADLLLVTRNLGVVADVVQRLGGEEGWFGPAAYDERLAILAP